MPSKYCEFICDLCADVTLPLSTNNNIFMAYSSHDKGRAEILRNSCAELNELTDVNWKTWEEDMDIENQLIFCKICKSICESKAILVELSDFNFNVIFEYGYALGLQKKIHPTVNRDFDYSDIDKFITPLMGFGIGKYDPDKFANKMLKKKFWTKESSNNLIDFTDNILSDDLNIPSNKVLYIKNIDRPEITEAIEKELECNRIQVIIDDAQEEANNMLWYCRQIKNSFAVIVDLGEADNKKNTNHFLKCALIAGLCIATGRRTLIINSSHKAKPSDIISMVKQYANAKDTKKYVRNFIETHNNSLEIISSYVSTIQRKKESRLSNIDLGDYVAENDFILDKAFIEPAEYHELQKRGYKLIIGRKGTGKSASFQMFSKKVIPNTININKLFNRYNLDDIYNLTILFDAENDKNKIIVAFWKFIIFLIIAKETYIHLTSASNGNHIDKEKEKYITDYQNLTFIDKEKSSTELLVDIFHSINNIDIASIKDIQQHFYSNEIIQLKNVVKNYYKLSQTTLILNIDGIDSNLSVYNNSKIIPLLIYNLHEVCSKLLSDASYHFSINLFIRSDIYEVFKNKITQKDKINKIFFKWDSEQLIFIINKRLQENNINHITNILAADLNIKTLFTKLKKYVYTRPRDYIFFFNNALSIANSMKLDYIDSRVFNDALDRYQYHVYESIEAELLSLGFEVPFNLFLTESKKYIKPNLRIPIYCFNSILETLSFDEIQKKEFISFLLNIQFIFYIENQEPIDWTDLNDPEAKLRYILDNSDNRKCFSFHPIIDIILKHS